MSFRRYEGHATSEVLAAVIPDRPSLLLHKQTRKFSSGTLVACMLAWATRPVRFHPHKLPTDDRSSQSRLCSCL